MQNNCYFYLVSNSEVRIQWLLFCILIAGRSYQSMVLRNWPPLSFGSTVQPAVFMSFFILLCVTPVFFQVEVLSVVKLKAAGVFSASVGRLSLEHAPNWVGISLGLLPGSTSASCLWGQQLSALLASTASIRAAPWNTNLECYKKKSPSIQGGWEDVKFPLAVWGRHIY